MNECSFVFLLRIRVMGFQNFKLWSYFDITGIGISIRLISSYGIGISVMDFSKVPVMEFSNVPLMLTVELFSYTSIRF